MKYDIVKEHLNINTTWTYMPLLHIIFQHKIYTLIINKVLFVNTKNLSFDAYSPQIESFVSRVTTCCLATALTCCPVFLLRSGVDTGVDWRYRKICLALSQIKAYELSGEHVQYFLCCFDAWTYPNALSVEECFQTGSPDESVSCFHSNPSTSCLKQMSGAELFSESLLNSHWWLLSPVYKQKVTRITEKDVSKIFECFSLIYTRTCCSARK